jgi:molybdopterin-guanine dinucleotide biosynthesis protein A
MTASGIILAGGRSSRMGRDKTLMLIETDTLIERTVKELRKITDEIIIASNQSGKYNLPGTREVPDQFPGRGPLGGIHAGLKAASYPYAFVVAGDMPLFSVELAAYLLARTDEGFDVIAPEINGSWEPLCAVYSRSCLQIIEQYLEAGIGQVSQFYKNVNVLKIDEQVLAGLCGPGDIFYNLNTPQDYEALLAMKKRS